MSAPTSLTSAQQQQRTHSPLGATSVPASPTRPDLIECKFDELARRILDELKQSHYSRDFFQALELILAEPEQARQRRQTRRLQAFLGQPGVSPGKRAPKVERQTAELAKTCGELAERQRKQQELLDNHQQILFDCQYRSLPSEITGAKPLATRAKEPQPKQSKQPQPQPQPQQQQQQQSRARPGPLVQTTPTVGSRPTSDAALKRNSSAGKLNLNQSPGRATARPTAVSPANKQQRSAIPTSTILSGINQLMRSATTGSFTEPTGDGALARQSSMRLGWSGNEQADSPARATDTGGRQQSTLLTPSEKIRQRRPTKASILDNIRNQSNQPSIDDSDDDSDSDDDYDDNYDYKDLASRRAYLNQRFIRTQAEPQESSPKALPGPVVKSKTLSDAPGLGAGAGGRVISPATNGAQQRQRGAAAGPPIVRSQTVLVRPQQQHRQHKKQQQLTSGTNKGLAGVKLAEEADEDDEGDFLDVDVGDEEEEEAAGASVGREEADQPRSIDGLLASKSGNLISGRLYKPHMNYSTSLLGNHRLSDDDEIIIIPTAQSPSPLIMSASQSPVNQRHHPQHPGQSQTLNYATDNNDRQHGAQEEETTAAAAAAAAAAIGGNLDEFNERFSISRTKSFWERLASSKRAAATTADSGAAAPNQQPNQQGNRNPAGDTTGAKLIHHQHSTIKGALERLDSTSGSGNSHYSGCSSNSSGSNSGDEQQMMIAHANTIRNGGSRSNGNGSNGTIGASRGAPGGQRAIMKQSQPGAPAPQGGPRTVSQLVQRQEQISRMDRFRQTR